MHIERKIKAFPYFALAGLAMIASWFWCQSWIERGAISLVTFATVTGHWLLAVNVKELVTSAVSEKESEVKKAKKRMIILYIVKLVLLFIALSLSVQLMGKRVIIAGANYFALLVIFAFSIRLGEK